MVRGFSNLMKLMSETASEPRKLKTLFLLNFYDTFLREEQFQKCAAALEMTTVNLHRLIKIHPALATARKLAEERRGNRSTLSGYVFQRLSKEAKAIWDEIQFWEDAGSNYEQIEAILNGHTRQLQQELFIHALVTSNYDLSSACRMIGVSRGKLNTWREDLEFRQLVEEIQWHKKNFFEKQLVALVEQQNPAAVIFVNKTINGDRGYNEKITLEHSGQIEVGFSIDELELPLDVRKIILDAVRKKKASKVIDMPGEGPIPMARQLVNGR